MHDHIVDARLSPKGIKPVRNGHPWIFRNALASPVRPAHLSGAIERTALGPDALVWDHTRPAIVRDTSGEALGWGVYNPVSRLAIRMLTHAPDAVPIVSLLESRLTRAVRARSALFAGNHTVFRLVFGEADGIPGLVVDRFDTTLVLQISGAFAWDNREVIARLIGEIVAGHGIEAHVQTTIDETTLRKDGVELQRSDLPDVRDDRIIVRENGLDWIVEPGAGQKTGHFCDQRENRAALRAYATGARVLDCFTYHGGFALNALAAGAQSAVCLDSSATALSRLEENAEHQRVSDRVHTVRGDAFALLRTGAIGEHALDSFDLVILDPPKLVSQRGDLDAGLRAYKDLNLSAFRGVRRGARVATFSCSGSVSRDQFRKALAWAAADVRRAGRSVSIETSYSHAPDHPIPLHFPEAEYLKGYLLRIE